MEHPEDVRSRILEAAEQRFRQFGFGKTTMAEIAQDCAMSAGNLYRYFENKEDLGAAISMRCMTTREECGRAVLREQGLSATQRLEALIFGFARDIHELATEHKCVNELVAMISEKRWDLVDRHLKTVVGLFAEVLARGNESGEFEIKDVQATSWAMLAACKGFLYPPLVAMCTMEELERDAHRITKLLVHGLAKR